MQKRAAKEAGKLTPERLEEIRVEIARDLVATVLLDPAIGAESVSSEIAEATVDAFEDIVECVSGCRLLVHRESRGEWSIIVTGFEVRPGRNMIARMGPIGKTRVWGAARS